MADLAPVAASVVAADGAVTKAEHLAGAAIAAGQWLYMDTANSNVMKLAKASGTLLEATVYGMALCSAALNQPVLVATAGDLDFGCVLTVGQVYILSANAGNICPVADLAASSYCSIVGVGTVADNLQIKIHNSGVEKP
ncbi:MAG: hypothetical protein WC829_24620 [Hyphomicrobium sp.]|jgi:hypothetical protein